jgi:hypothetical protein
VILGDQEDPTLSLSPSMILDKTASLSSLSSLITTAKRSSAGSGGLGWAGITKPRIVNRPDVMLPYGASDNSGCVLQDTTENSGATREFLII